MPNCVHPYTSPTDALAIKVSINRTLLCLSVPIQPRIALRLSFSETVIFSFSGCSQRTCSHGGILKVLSHKFRDGPDPDVYLSTEKYLSVYP